MKIEINKSEQGPVLAKGGSGNVGSNCKTYGYNTTDNQTVGVNKNGIGFGVQGEQGCINGGINPVNQTAGVSCSC